MRHAVVAAQLPAKPCGLSTSRRYSLTLYLSNEDLRMDHGGTVEAANEFLELRTMVRENARLRQFNVSSSTD